MLAFPSILLALFLVAVVGPSDWIIILALTILYAPGFTRFARGMAISLRERAFVEASVISGARPRYVIWKTPAAERDRPARSSASRSRRPTRCWPPPRSRISASVRLHPLPAGATCCRRRSATVFQDWHYGIWPGLCIVIVALGYMLVSEGIEVAVQRSGSAGADVAVDTTGTTPAHGRGHDRERGVVTVGAAQARARPAGRESGDVVLSIDDLVVDFPLENRTVRAVDRLSFTIGPGQRLGVVGESGSGKSTVAMAVLGLLEPPGRIVEGSITLGELELGGAEEDVLRSVRGGRIAMIFQDALGSLNPVKTIGYQLTEAIRLHTDAGKSDAGERAVELLAEVGVQSPRARLAQYPHEFSGGMRQRVMIAMALASDPELLIADEPTTALDVTTQAGVIDLLHRLSDERQMAVMLITHDLGIIASFAEDVLVMYAGAPVEYGAVDEVFERAGHPYTQALIAAVPQLGDERAADSPVDPGRASPGRRDPARLQVRAALPARRRARDLPHRAPCLRRSPSPRAASPATSRTSRARRPGVIHREEISLGEPSIGSTLLTVRRPRQGLPRPRRSRRAQALAPRRRRRVVRDQERRVARPRRRVGIRQVDRRPAPSRAHASGRAGRSRSRDGRSRRARADSQGSIGAGCRWCSRIPVTRSTR